MVPADSATQWEAYVRMQGYRPESGLAARAPCPNRGDGGIPTAMIIVIGINLVAVMPGSGYVRFQSGRLNRLYGKCQFNAADCPQWNMAAPRYRDCRLRRPLCACCRL